MLYPLFVHTQPTPSDSAIVLVAKGDWSIELDNTDSVLNLAVGSDASRVVYESIQNGQIISLNAPAPIRASIVVGGKEKHLSLSLNDNRPSHS